MLLCISFTCCPTTSFLGVVSSPLILSPPSYAPWGKPGGLSPLDMPPPVPRPPLTPDNLPLEFPTVMFLFLLFLSPQPSRPKLSLLWHDFPDWSLRWLSLRSSHLAGRREHLPCEVLESHGVASTVRVEMTLVHPCLGFPTRALRDSG